MRENGRRKASRMNGTNGDRKEKETKKRFNVIILHYCHTFYVLSSIRKIHVAEKLLWSLRLFKMRCCVCGSLRYSLDDAIHGRRCVRSRSLSYNWTSDGRLTFVRSRCHVLEAAAKWQVLDCTVVAVWSKCNRYQFHRINSIIKSLIFAMFL